VSHVRFQLDAHLSSAIAEALKRVGADIHTATEAGLRGQPDTAYIQRGIDEDRVIVTNDKDFLRLAHLHPGHSGIIYCTSSRNITPIIMELLLVYEILDSDDLHGNVHYISSDRR
jgi:predicted nuclease of predicted toxin-antitoxin system